LKRHMFNTVALREQRRGIGNHVPRVADQRERAGPPAGRGLDTGETERDRNGEHKLAAVGGLFALILGKTLVLQSLAV
jgi:hypothetical protein